MEWLNFRHLYSFWMVHRFGGFNNAAKEMNVSQSTVSEQVALLEDHFQKTLFLRSSRNLKLSEAGRMVFHYAEQIFETSKKVNLLVGEEVESSIQRNIKIGISGDLSRNLLYRFFGKALNEDMIEKFEVYSGNFRDLLKACTSYEIDGVISMRPPLGKDLALMESHIIKTSKIAVIGKKRILRRFLNGKGREFDIYLYNFPYFEGDIAQKLSKRHKVEFHKKLETDDISLLRFFATSGKGLAIMPEVGVREDLLQGSLEALTIDFVKPVSFYFSYPKVSAKGEIFDELLRSFKEEVKLLKSI